MKADTKTIYITKDAIRKHSGFIAFWNQVPKHFRHGNWRGASSRRNLCHSILNRMFPVLKNIKPTDKWEAQITIKLLRKIN